MGAGKSTLGKRLARRLQLHFIDSDRFIEQQTNCSIPTIFERWGEEYFRELEKEFVLKLSTQDGIVLATGGGMPCFNNVLPLLKKMGLTIYLQRPAEELAHRIVQGKQKRPLIKGQTQQELIPFVQNMLNERQTYYEQAHIIAQRDEQTVNQLIELITSYQRNTI